VLDNPTAAWATGALAVLAAIGVLVPPMLDDMGKRREAARSHKERISELVPTWPLALADANPYEQLRVTLSAKAQEHEFDGVRAPYVDRVTEPDLATAMRESTFVLLRGPSKAGKSRTAFEVARRVFPDALAIVPRRPRPDHPTLAEVLKTLDLERSAGARKVILWLDDLQDFVSAGSIDESLWTALTSHEPRISVVATIRDTAHDLILGGATASEQFAVSESSRKQALDLIARATEVVLPSILGPTELEEAERRYPGEDFSVGLGAQLVDAPYLIQRFETGRSSNPAGAAIVQAAVDWSRAGVPRPVARSELFTLGRVHDYRPSAAYVPAFTDERLADGLAWACQRQPSGLSLLREADDTGDTFVSFDYLEDYAEGAVEDGRGERPIPGAAWSQLIELLDADDAFAVGVVAMLRAEMSVARDAWARTEATSADPEQRLTASLLATNTLRSLSRNDEARERLERLVHAAHESGSSQEGIILSNLGLARLAVGEREGVQDLERAVELNESTADPKEWRAELLLNLGLGYQSMYDREGAVAALERGLALIEKDEEAEGEDPGDLTKLMCLTLLGGALTRVGREDEALAHLERARSLAEDFGDPPAIVASILLARGNALATRGDRAAALSDIEAAYDLRVESLGPRQLAVAEPLVTRAALKLGDDDAPGAVDDLRLALAVVAESLGEHHLETAMVRKELANALTACDEHREAYEQLAATRADLTRWLGPSHATVARFLYALAVAADRVGRSDEALGTFRDCLAAEEAVYGPDDQTLAFTLHWIGILSLNSGDAHAARESLERALAIRDAAAEPDAEGLIAVLEPLARALVADDDDDRAQETVDRLSELARGAPEHVQEFAAALEIRGGIRERQGDLSGAHHDLEQALEIVVRIHGEYHPDVTRVLHRLGVVLRDLGDPAAAKSRLEWALAIYGPDARDKPIVSEIFDDLEPVLGEVPDPGVPATWHAARDYVHDLRRRALDGQDMSSAFRSWTGDDEYRRREQELEQLGGSELTGALERYLVVQAIVELWQEVRRDAATPEAVARELDEHVKGRLADLFLTVKVDMTAGETPTVPHVAT
jgi:tetratricopeptide (TPR) repeat protein